MSRSRLLRGVFIACNLAIAWFGAFPSAANAGDAEPGYVPDWAHIADIMIRRDIQLAPGERVLLEHDAARDPGLVAAVRTAIVRAGGIVSAELTWPSKSTGEYLATLSESDRRRREEDEDRVYRTLFANSDVFVWLQTSPVDEVTPRRVERLIAESHLRAVHSHWFESMDPSENERLRRMNEAAIEVAPDRLKAIESRLASHLRGTTVHLTSPAGTDLTFMVPATAWFHLNNGEASRLKTADARSTRDREEEIPAGALRTTDVVGTRGLLIATLPQSTLAGAVAVTFRDGRAVDFAARGGKGADTVKEYREMSGDRDRVSELVIGTNPALAPILPSGFMPYYGYGDGIVRIAMGDNWESGGTLRTEDHNELWLFVADGTLTANGRTLIKDGKIVPETH